MIQAELRIARGKMPAEMAAVPADFVEFAFFLAQRFAGRVGASLDAPTADARGDEAARAAVAGRSCLFKLSQAPQCYLRWTGTR